MALVVPSVVSSMNSLFIGAFLPSLPLDSLLSTQGIMILLLVAYAGAMWMFLTSAPKVHTVMVSDLEVARQFYEGLLNLPFYAGASVEAGNVWARRSDIGVRSIRKNASLFLGLDTPLGPALFATGFDSRGRHAFYLSLGLGF